MRENYSEPITYSSPSIQYNIDTFKYEPDQHWDTNYTTIYPWDNRDTLDYCHQYQSFEQTYPGLHEDETTDLIHYSKVRPSAVDEWKAHHIMGWIIELYQNEGFSYESVNMHLLRNLNGSDLLKLPEYKFYEIHESKGRWLYQKVRDLAYKTDPMKFSFTETQFKMFGNTDATFSSGSDCEAEPVKQKKRGRPRSLNKIRRKSEHKTGKLWEFLRDLLLNPEFCPSLICWENHEQGVFRFVCSDKVAKIWGSKRGNNEMNYEKLSRAMRYYYKNKVLLPVLGKRLVYKFGPNAVGWRTNNPNFENNNL